jgi:ABC-type Fe3+-hydroxamate transport system substrate-binding protein
MVKEIREQINGLNYSPSYRVAYLIWQNPYMVAGGATYINDMLRKCGLINIFHNESRYPAVLLEQFQDADIILLSSEPYPFTAEHVHYMKKHFPEKRVFCVDGAYFSWYGSRLKYAATYFREFRKRLDKDDTKYRHV